MAERSRLRANGGHEGRSERPATGHGRPRSHAALGLEPSGSSVWGVRRRGRQKFRRSSEEPPLSSSVRRSPPRLRAGTKQSKVTLGSDGARATPKPRTARSKKTRGARSGTPRLSMHSEYCRSSAPSALPLGRNDQDAVTLSRLSRRRDRVRQPPAIAAEPAPMASISTVDGSGTISTWTSSSRQVVEKGDCVGSTAYP